MNQLLLEIHVNNHGRKIKISIHRIIISFLSLTTSSTSTNFRKMINSILTNLKNAK
jgi:hypothetical protein